MIAAQILIQAEAGTAVVVTAALTPTMSPVVHRQAVCSCGWRSPVFGADKTTGTMDPLQHATEAADLHEWEMSLRLAALLARADWPVP